MEIHQIATKRSWQHNYAYDLVYEWEDIFSELMNVPFHFEKAFIYNRYFKLIPFLPTLFQTKALTLEFEMSCISSHWFTNRKRNIIPFIIDFYPQEKGLYGLEMFNRLYSIHPVVFVSSAEVYEYLMSLGKNLKVNVKHVALSLSDKYRLDPKKTIHKEYDLVLMGRQSPVFLDYLERYKQTHPDFLYVYNKRINGKCLYYTSNGILIDDINTRTKYMTLLKKARCAFYTTPGIDSEKNTNGFNQITPRFLELLSCGCHILARYEDNADARYYEIDKFSKKIETFEEFESALDYGRNNKVDLNWYSKYLEKHYTSTRVNQVKEIINYL